MDRSARPSWECALGAAHVETREKASIDADGQLAHAAPVWPVGIRLLADGVPWELQGCLVLGLFHRTRVQGGEETGTRETKERKIERNQSIVVLSG
jgi:hypothetical protein